MLTHARVTQVQTCVLMPGPMMSDVAVSHPLCQHPSPSADPLPLGLMRIIARLCCRRVHPHVPGIVTVVAGKIPSNTIKIVEKIPAGRWGQGLSVQLSTLGPMGGTALRGWWSGWQLKGFKQEERVVRFLPGAPCYIALWGPGLEG